MKYFFKNKLLFCFLIILLSEPVFMCASNITMHLAPKHNPLKTETMAYFLHRQVLETYSKGSRHPKNIQIAFDTWSRFIEIGSTDSLDYAYAGAEVFLEKGKYLEAGKLFAMLAAKNYKPINASLMPEEKAYGIVEKLIKRIGNRGTEWDRAWIYDILMLLSKVTGNPTAEWNVILGAETLKENAENLFKEEKISEKDQTTLLEYSLLIYSQINKTTTYGYMVLQNINDYIFKYFGHDENLLGLIFSRLFKNGHDTEILEHSLESIDVLFENISQLALTDNVDEFKSTTSQISLIFTNLFSGNIEELNYYYRKKLLNFAHKVALEFTKFDTKNDAIKEILTEQASQIWKAMAKVPFNLAFEQANDGAKQLLEQNFIIEAGNIWKTMAQFKTHEVALDYDDLTSDKWDLNPVSFAANAAYYMYFKSVEKIFLSAEISILLNKNKIDELQMNINDINVFINELMETAHLSKDPGTKSMNFSRAFSLLKQLASIPNNNQENCLQ